MRGGVGLFNWSITVYLIYFVFTWYISMTFSRLVRMVGNLLFFFDYWFLDEVSSIKEVQKTSRLFWIYISIFTQQTWFIHVFLFFNFYYNIYVTDPIIDAYEVNNGRHYQCQSSVWAHMGIMRRGQYSKILTD